MKSTIQSNWTRLCPCCGGTLSYSSAKKLKQATNANSRGRCCASVGRKLSDETKAKVGRPATSERRRKISIANGGTGSLNQKYVGLRQWTTRNKAKTPFCAWCYSEDKLEAHHILPKAKYPQHATEDWNCRILCEGCHTTCHKQGGF